MSQRDYNHVYTLGRFILQIMQDGQHDGIAIDLVPQVTLAMANNRCSLALGFNWLMGTVNLGIMTAQYRKLEEQRQEKVKEQAKKMNITPRQYALRWGW
jgi:hypothetical protein